MTVKRDEIRDKNIQNMLDFKTSTASNEIKNIIIYKFYRDLFNELNFEDQQVMIKDYTDLDYCVKYGEIKW
jgi:hypothetical protein|tara:strand:+ start:207 stop:419 length:213 start_codon:yes stop_codon:yes gene_type:complete